MIEPSLRSTMPGLTNFDSQKFDCTLLVIIRSNASSAERGRSARDAEVDRGVADEDVDPAIGLVWPSAIEVLALRLVGDAAGNGGGLAALCLDRRDNLLTRFEVAAGDHCSLPPASANISAIAPADAARRASDKRHRAGQVEEGEGHRVLFPVIPGSPAMDPLGARPGTHEHRRRRSWSGFAQRIIGKGPCSWVPGSPLARRPGMTIVGVTAFPSPAGCAGCRCR